MISEIKNSKLNLETQIRDLERLYTDEAKFGNELSARQISLQNAIRKYRDNYGQLDRLNRMIQEGYEKTRRELESYRQLAEE